MLDDVTEWSKAMVCKTVIRRFKFLCKGFRCFCRGRAYVTGDNIVTVSNIGSRDATLTATIDTSGQILLFTGCFSGTIDQFIAAVKEKHAGTVHERNYMAAIEFIKVRLSKME